MKIATIINFTKVILLSTLYISSTSGMLDQVQLLRHQAANLRSENSPQAIWFDFLAHLDEAGCRPVGSIDERSFLSVLQKSLAELPPEEASQLRNCLLIHILSFKHALHIDKNNTRKSPYLWLVAGTPAIGLTFLAALRWKYVSPQSCTFGAFAIALSVCAFDYILKKNERVRYVIADSLKTQMDLKYLLRERLNYIDESPLQLALARFEKEGIETGNALDLGCGECLETYYLLKKGWSVTAVDVNTRTLARFLNNPDIKRYVDRLTILEKDYFTLNWESLPSLNLLVALRLPAEKDAKKFSDLLEHCVKKIMGGGRFLGVFQCALSQNEIREELFKEFDIEIFAFENNHKSYLLPHTCRILARKKHSA